MRSSYLPSVQLHLLAAALFHGNLGDQMQAILFWKNVALAGGFLMLMAHGPGAYSLESALVRRRAA